MAEALAQQPPPGEASRRANRQNVYYPQARVTLSVVFENFGVPESPRAFPVAPRSVTVYSNSYKEADTFSVEFDAQDLPVTPDLIRGGSVEIYLFQTPGIGQSPEVIKARSAAGQTSAFAESDITGLEPTIVGLFDEVTLDMSDSGKTVSIDGTDYTSLFIAKQWNPRKSGNGRGRIPSGDRLDRVLRKLMAQVESANAMTLEVIPSDVTMPTVGKSEARTNKNGMPARGQKNYWDVMYDLAVRHGFILYVQGLKVVLIELEEAIKQKQANVRKMAWGRNLESLRISRRIGKETVPIFECRSYDEKRKRLIKGRYPENAKQVPVTGLGTRKEEIVTVFVPGVRSEKQLKDIARAYYHARARAEQSIEISTMDLRDLEGNDLIELRTGDALAIGFDPFNAEVTLLEGQTEERRVQTLTALGYDAEVAKTIAKTFDRVNLFRAPFRVKEATLEWSDDGGLSIQAELQNFINIKDQEP